MFIQAAVMECAINEALDLLLSTSGDFHPLIPHTGCNRLSSWPGLSHLKPHCGPW